MKHNIVCGCGDTFGDGSVCANCLCGKYVEAAEKVADDVVGNEWTDVVRELMAVASYRPSCQKYVLDRCRCYECVNERMN